MRRVLIPIAAGVALGVIVTGVLAFFMTSKESMGWVDGLGRPLVPAPWLARLVFGANREWAGQFWFLADLVWFWGGLGIAFFLGSRAGEQSKNSKLPNALAAIIGIVVVIGTAYFTLHVIKLGVALALETRRAVKPLPESADPLVMANFPLVDSQKWSKFSDKEQDVYVQDLLETWSFVLYSMTDSRKPSREFSDFIACIEREKPLILGLTRLTILMALGNLKDPLSIISSTTLRSSVENTSRKATALCGLPDLSKRRGGKNLARASE